MLLHLTFISHNCPNEATNYNFYLLTADQEIEIKTNHNGCQTDKYGIDCPLVNISEMENPEEFNKIKQVVFLVSTYGDGDPTSDCSDFNNLLKDEDFWDKITNKELKYTVFGCGSKFYPEFNAQAKLFDKCFSKHGFAKICPICFGDDAEDIRADFKKWTSEVFWPNFIKS